MAPWTKVFLCLRMAQYTLPLANDLIAGWRMRAAQIAEPALRAEALASLNRKAFHAQGGATLAADCRDRTTAQRLVTAITAFQVMVDYLDNLCDRLGSQSGAAMAELHHAVTDALDLRREPQPYFMMSGGADDGGYLEELVTTCRRQLLLLPGYGGPLAAGAQAMGQRYGRLQVCKHLTPQERDLAVRNLLSVLGHRCPQLSWWELAAACGSTLGIFAFFAAAACPEDQPPASALAAAYFPWVGAWHILLDYLIDLGEDRQFNDMNFVGYYPNLSVALARLRWLQRQAMDRARSLPHAGLHELVVAGLPGVYLSDPKVREQHLEPVARQLMAQSGGFGRAAYLLCRMGAVRR